MRPRPGNREVAFRVLLERQMDDGRHFDSTQRLPPKQGRVAVEFGEAGFPADALPRESRGRRKSGVHVQDERLCGAPGTRQEMSEIGR
jgi:hypothetical protein